MKHINRRTRTLMEDAAGYAFISPWLLGFVAFSIIPISSRSTIPSQTMTSSETRYSTDWKISEDGR